ncbi:hypothetical protein HQ531_15245 [bacterium]|nr:hypothetical protein [bacterium]
MGNFSIYVRYILIVVCIGLFTSLFAGVLDYSFRAKGLGPSALDFTHDSYSDVFYNPAYIANISGFHVFTNLSNLGRAVPGSILTNELSTISNALYPTNLVGFLGRWKFLSGGAFYATEGMKLHLEYNEKDDYSYTDDESLHSSYQTKYNSDSKTDIGLSGRQIVGIGTINLFGLRLGVLGKLKSFKAEYSYEEVSQDKSYEDGQLLLNTRSEHIDKLSVGRTVFGVTVGTLIGGENTELSISGGINPGAAAFSSEFVDEWLRKPLRISDDYTVYDDSQPNRDQDNYSDVYEVSLVGSEIFANARLMRRIGERTHTSIIGKISTSIFPITLTDESSDASEYSTPDYYYPPNEEQQYYGYSYSSEYSSKRNGEGNFNLSKIEAGLGFQHVFENGTLFILGVKGHYARIAMSLDYDARTTTTLEQDIYNDPSYPSYGYRQTVNYRNPVSLNGTGNLLYLEIPSALEFNFFESWQFRVGSNQKIPLWGNGKWDATLEDKPDTRTTEYTHGELAGQTIIETDDEGTRNEEINAKISSSSFNLSSFHTGLGYKVNDNVTLDILHYSNLSHLNTWYLSFSVHF